MALIVEDGSGKSDAESYISVADAITYLSARGDTTFAALATADAEAALRNATDYMLEEYRYKWAGYRFGLTQNLDWPRSYVPVLDVAFGYGPAPSYYAFDAIPLPVGYACAKLALEASTADLAPAITPEDTAISTKIGPIAIVYNKYAPSATFYRAAHNLLKPYLEAQGGSTRLIRT